MSQEKLSYEQLEAAFFLVATDLAFICFEGASPFIGPAETEMRSLLRVTYQVETNLNDTFYWACADSETIPWDEVVEIVAKLKTLDTDKERSYYLVDWASKKRGHDPKIGQVVNELNAFRKKWSEA